MILGQDKARLSKRHGATSALAYRDMGYLPAAMINYLARLGWSHGDQEIFSREEMIEHFSFDSVNTSAAVFDPDKLSWLNEHYIKNTPPEELVPHLELCLISDCILQEGNDLFSYTDLTLPTPPYVYVSVLAGPNKNTQLSGTNEHRTKRMHRMTPVTAEDLTLPEDIGGVS